MAGEFPTYQNPDTGEIVVFNGVEWAKPSKEEAANVLVELGQKKQPFTASQILSEENRPISRGLQAMSEEATAGLEEFTAPGVLGKITGPMRALLSPTVGAGAAIGTGVQNTLADVPGFGGAAGAIPAGGAAISDAVTQLLTGQFLGGGGARTLKAGVKGAGEIFAPGVLREAGTEVAARTLGQPLTTIERVFTTPKSKALFQAAEKESATIPVSKLTNAFDDLIKKESSRSTQIPEALQRLRALQRKYTPKISGKVESTYSGLMEEAQQLALRARGLRETNPNAAVSLRKARETILDIMDQASPAIRKANSQVRKEMFSSDIIEAIRKSDPATSVRSLFEAEREGFSKVFNKKTLATIESISEEISDVAKAQPAGLARQIFSGITEPIGQMLSSNVGRRLLRYALAQTDPRKTVAVIGVAKLWQEVGEEGLSTDESSRSAFSGAFSGGNVERLGQ